MPELPIIQQQFSQQSNRASASDFGAIEGGAKQDAGNSLQQLGGALSDIEARRRNRKDTIERVRAINEYNRVAEVERTRMTTEEDLTDTEAPVRYSQFLKDKAGEILGNHSGTDASRAELEVRLEGSKGTFQQGMYKESTSAQFKAMGSYMGDVIKGISDLAGDLPDTVEDQFRTLDVELDQMAAALTVEQEEAFRDQGRSEIIKSATSTYINSGDYDAANGILVMDGVAETLSPDVHRQLKSQTIIGLREREKSAIQAEAKLNEVRVMLGREPTAQERARAAGVAPPASSRVTLSEKVSSFEQVTGRAATDAEISKMAGADVTGASGGSFGKSIKGRSLDIMNDHIVGFANGTLDPAVDREVQAAVNEYTQPITFTNPETGLIETRTARLPGHVVEAMTRRGIDVPSSASSTEDTSTAIHPDPNIAVQPLDIGQQGLWELIPEIAGPVAAIEGVIEATPFIGGLTDQNVTRAVTRIKGLQRNVVTALQNNPKYAIGEMNAIQEEIDLLPGIFSNPENAIAKLISVDANLEARQNFALNTMNDRTLPLDARKAASNVFNLVNNVRSQINMPPVMKTAEEANKLPPGTVFIANGRLKKTSGQSGDK